MKKSIILLTTLLFITALSTLVIINLSNTDKYLQQQNYKFNTSQVLISVMDAQLQLSKLINENKTAIDRILEDGSLKIPLKLHEVDLDIVLSNYSKKNMNDLNDEAKKKSIQELLEMNEINNYPLLEEVYKEKTDGISNGVSSDKQLDDIINTFIKRAYSKDMLKIRHEFGFSSNTVYQLDVEVKYNYIKAKGKYYLDKNGKVEYFNVDFI